MKKIKIALITALVLPNIAFGATRTLRDLIGLLAGYLNTILELMMGVAVVLFVYQVIKYFMLPKDTRKEGNQYVMWSLIGFFVILSFWGLVNILRSTFELNSNTPSWTEFQNIFPK